MKTPFKDLCSALNLNTAAPTDEALLRVQQWYLDNVSQDQYTRDYLKAARD